MKLVHFLPPAAALVLSGLWIGTKRSSVTDVENEIVVLRKIVTEARIASAQENATPTEAAKTKDELPTDWKELALQMENMASGNAASIRDMIQLQQRLLEMTEEEILAALDELAAADPGSTETLKITLIGILCDKNPKLALNRFVGHLQEDNSLSWMLSSAIGKWSKTDSNAAITWMDQQINAGAFDSKKLDGKNPLLIRFETSLISSLLESGSMAAISGRLSSFPEDEKMEILRGIHNDQIDTKAYAELTRSNLKDEKNVREAIASAAARRASQGFGQVTEFLDAANASPEERTAAVEQSVSIGSRKKPDRENIDEMRVWVESQSPGSQDRLTGEYLGRAVRRSGNRSLNFTEAAAFAVEYHEKSGNDEVLGAFLGEWPAREEANKEESRALAEKISDPELREEILKKLK